MSRFCRTTAVCRDKDHLLSDTHGSPSCCFHTNPWPFHCPACGSCGRWHDGGGVCVCVCVCTSRNFVALLSFILFSRNELLYVDSPQRTAWMNRLTNVDGTRTQQFPFKDNARPSMYHSLWQLISQAGLYGTVSAYIWTGTLFLRGSVLYLFPSHELWCLYIFVIMFNIFLAWSLCLCCTTRLGVPCLCLAEGPCPIVGSVFSSGREQERDILPITCLGLLLCCYGLFFSINKWIMWIRKWWYHSVLDLETSRVCLGVYDAAVLGERRYYFSVKVEDMKCDSCLDPSEPDASLLCSDALVGQPARGEVVTSLVILLWDVSP